MMDSLPLPQRRGHCLPAFDPFLTDSTRRAGYRDMRQGAPGNDAGSGWLSGTARSHRARRSDAAPEEGEDAGKVQSIGARYSHGELTLEQAAELGCRACGSPGGGCQFLGTAATSQVVAEALGLTRSSCRSRAFRATDLARDGPAIRAGLVGLAAARIDHPRHPHARLDPQRDDRPRGVSAARRICCLHIPAIAFAAGLDRPNGR